METIGLPMGLHFRRNTVAQSELDFDQKSALIGFFVLHISTRDLPPEEGDHPHLLSTLSHIFPYPALFLFGGYLGTGEHYCKSELCRFFLSLPSRVSSPLYCIGRIVNVIFTTYPILHQSV